MSRADTYRDFAELEANEQRGVDYEVEWKVSGRDPRVVVMAPHGGGIEPHTDQIAAEIAGGEFVFYAFRGLKHRLNCTLHITSTHFDESEAVRLAEQAEVVLAVHGKSGQGEFAMLGGQHRGLRQGARTVLRGKAIEIRPAPPHVAARSDDNICNRCQQGGVQIELSMSLRNHLLDNRRLSEKVAGGLRRALREAVADST